MMLKFTKYKKEAEYLVNKTEARKILKAGNQAVFRIFVLVYIYLFINDSHSSKGSAFE